MHTVEFIYITHLNAGMTLYLASNDTAKKVAISWLVAMTIVP